MNAGSDYPKEPVEALIQQATHLRVLYENDRELLENFGLSVKHYRKLVKQTEKCAKMEQAWLNYKEKHQRKTRDLAEYFKECRDFASQLRSYIRIIVVDNGIVCAVPEVPRTRTREAISEYLLNLAVAAESLAGMVSNTRRLSRMALKSRRMSRKLLTASADHHISRPAMSDAKERRNHAAHALSKTIGIIRSAGREVFRDIPTRRKAYTSGRYRGVSK